MSQKLQCTPVICPLHFLKKIGDALKSSRRDGRSKEANAGSLVADTACSVIEVDQLNTSPSGGSEDPDTGNSLER